MIEWDYAQVPTRCGGCPNTLEIGDPLQRTHIHGVKRVLVRCVECAGPAPDDLPPFVLAAPLPHRDDPPLPQREPAAVGDTWLPYRDGE